MSMPRSIFSLDDFRLTLHPCPRSGSESLCSRGPASAGPRGAAPTSCPWKRSPAHWSPWTPARFMRLRLVIPGAVCVVLRASASYHVDCFPTSAGQYMRTPSLQREIATPLWCSPMWSATHPPVCAWWKANGPSRPRDCSTTQP